MNLLLCYTKQLGLKNFKLDADIRASILTINRPAFNELKNDIADGKIGALVTADVSRISRDRLTTQKLVLELRKAGIELYLGYGSDALSSSNVRRIMRAIFLNEGGDLE